MLDEKPEPMRRAALALLSMQRHSWEQGVAMQAFFELGEREVVIAMAREAVCRRLDDGRAAVIGSRDAVTDPCAVGEALLAACRWTGDTYLQSGLGALLDWALRKAPRSAGGALYHLASENQFWADSAYMLPPFLLAAGYPDEAMANFRSYYTALYDAPAGLMSHIWDDKNRCFARRDHWGTGNGWTVAAIARMAPMLLAANRSEDAEDLVSAGQALLDRLLEHMRPDGLFTDIVDRPGTFVETNLSQMLAYAIYRGCAGGWLDRAYLPAADKMRAAAAGKLDAYGFVTGVCGAPDFNKPGFSPEGQAFYLLMENAAAACSRARL
ncbi:MAG: glycoside hydrolase family 88 protein [Clostridiales bacterium]|jgi:rhamnogalacturonyl hydrolase YesR|nr:glycoside hydrolase family 88 protein [Clostridiales bacterium]